MSINKLSLNELKKYIKDRSFEIPSLNDLENPLKDIDDLGLIYKKIELSNENEIDGYVDGYLMANFEEGRVLIPFYSVSELSPVVLRQPRLFDPVNDKHYFDKVKKDIQKKVTELKKLYDEIK